MENVVLRKNSFTETGSRICSWSYSKHQPPQLPKKRVKSDCTQNRVEKRRQYFLESRNITEVEENKDSGLESCRFYTNNSSDSVCQRPRLLYQRSLSLPDVVVSGSPVFKDSPDVLDFEQNDKSPEYVRSKSEGSKITQKAKIEGHVVCNKMPFTRSVSFKQGDEIINIGELNPISTVSMYGNEGRKHMRSKKISSGYGSKSDCQSIASNQSLLSIDMPSTEEKDIENNDQKKEKSSSVCTPCISLFDRNSNGSFCLNENTVSQLFCYPTPKPSPRTDPETISPFSQFCLDALELSRKKATPNLKKPSQSHVFSDEKQLMDELFLHHFQLCMQHLDEGACAQDLTYFDGFTPSPKIVPNSAKHEIPAKGITPQLEVVKKTQPEEVIFDDERIAFTPKYSEEQIESLERACRCHDPTCCDISCKEMKEALDGLREVINDYRTDVEPKYQQLLFNLTCHSERCDDFCKVPWCRILSNISNWTVKKAIKKIIDMETTLMDTCSTQSEGKCIKISESCQKRYSNMIKEGRDWFSLMPLNKYNNVVLAKEIQAKNNRNWVIKKTYLNDYDQQISVYKRLRRFISPYVVEHHWAIEDGSSLLTCTEFKSSGSLKRVLLETSEDKREIISWMVQVITGVLHLHKYDIIFLKWASKNIVINEKRRLQICDLSCSVLSTKCQAEYNEVKRSLPPTIIPPEMENDMVCDVTEKSDSWGCGCFLYELCNTEPVFHQMRHEKLEHQWTRMFQSKMPPLPKYFERYQHILNKCWAKNPEHRSSLEEIRNVFYRELKHQSES